MLRTRSVPEKKQQTTSPRGGLLALRVLNALPYSNSVKELYTKTKDSNDMLRLGFNLAETAAITVSSPFVSKYVAVDKFAASQLEKIEDKLGVDLVTKSVGTVAYPIGFGLGLAGYARNKLVDLATPAVELSYEVADVVIDQLLPPDYDETMEDEYIRRMSSLQQKSPFRRIKERANINSVARLPSTSLMFSMNLFSSTIYLCTGFATMSLSRMFSLATTLVNSINTQFASELQQPWTVISNGDLTKLYKAVLFSGVKSVNGLIDELEINAQELSEYLDNRNLPYNSEVVKYVASKLKSIERRLVRVGGVRLTSTSENVLTIAPAAASSSSSSSRVKPSTFATTPSHAPKRRNTANRTPTIMLGDDQPSWYEHEEAVHMHEEQVHQHKLEVLAERAPTMLWIPVEAESHTQKPKPHAVKKASAPKQEEVSKPIEEEEAKPIKEEAEPIKEESKPVKEAHVPEPNDETFKPTKTGYLEAALKPAAEPVEEVAEEPIQRIVPSAAPRPEVSLPRQVEEEVTEEAEDEVDEFGFAPVKPPTHGHLIPADVAKDMAERLLRPRHKRAPVTPVNSPADALSNNPYGDIITEESDVIRGPEVVDTHQAKIREHESVAHQKKLHKQTLHELLADVGTRLEKVERRAEENAQQGPWHAAKHGAHVHVEEQAPEPSTETLPAPENNPFAKLETETTEDPFSMGASTM